MSPLVGLKVIRGSHTDVIAVLRKDSKPIIKKRNSYFYLSPE